MRHLAVIATLALVTLGALADPAAAGTDTASLDARADELRAQLHGRGFTVVVEEPFVVVGDEPPAKVRRRAATTVRWAVSRLESDFFPVRPGRVITIWLFRDERSYRRGARAYFGDEPETPYGYYSSADDAIVMNIGPGAGTLVHELVHPYMEANLPGAPAWLNEGLASLFEYPMDHQGHIRGRPNWRQRNLRRELRAGTLPPLATLLATTEDEFYGAGYDSYAYARYLLLYAQERGALTDLFQAVVAGHRDDPTGARAVKRILGEDLEAVRRAWSAWVLSLPVP